MEERNFDCNPSTSFQNATGKIDYGLTNDYMFRVILQRHINVLKALICSLLHLQDEALSVVHIGFLDFQLFPEHPEFFGIYKFMNEKDHYLYSDKLTLGVVDLKHIELATEEDKAFQIDHWARLFKATTWEEIKMIAENNEYMTEATQALYEYNADYVIRQKCEAREEYERRQRTLHKKLSDAQEKIQEQEIERLKALLEQQ